MCSMSAITSALICQKMGFGHSRNKTVARYLCHMFFLDASYFSDERFGRSDVVSDFNTLSCSTGYTNITQCSVSTKGSGCYVSSTTCSTEYGIRCYSKCISWVLSIQYNMLKLLVVARMVSQG